MRRSKQSLPLDDTRQILREQTNGVLSLATPDGTPYGVPLSFAYDGENAIYFHGATQGRKLDCIGQGCRCSFCVVSRDSIVPEEFTTYFSSVIVSGSISVVDNRDEMLKGLLLLCEKYSPGIDNSSEIAQGLNHVCVLRLDITDITGKEAIELTRQRSAAR